MPFLKFCNLVSILIVALAFLLFYSYPSLHTQSPMADQVSSKSIYDFTVKDIRGNDVPLSDYKGKVLLIVNVASKCGLTESNYKELNVLYEKYKDQGFEILAFRATNLGGKNLERVRRFKKLSALGSRPSSPYSKRLMLMERIQNRFLSF